MNLSVAVWMDQDAVLCVVCPTECFIHNMVVVPSRYLGNRMATDWADASLFLPEIHQSSSSLQGLFHLYAQAFFKIEFPCRIVGVAIPFDLGVLSDGCCGSQAQPVLGGFTTLLFCRAEEAQFWSPNRPKYRSFTHCLPFFGCLRFAHRHSTLKMAASTRTKVFLAFACR